MNLLYHSRSFSNEQHVFDAAMQVRIDIANGDRCQHGHRPMCRYCTSQIIGYLNWAKSGVEWKTNLTDSGKYVQYPVRFYASDSVPAVHFPRLRSDIVEVCTQEYAPAGELQLSFHSEIKSKDDGSPVDSIRYTTSSPVFRRHLTFNRDNVVARMWYTEEVFPDNDLHELFIAAQRVWIDLEWMYPVEGGAGQRGEVEKLALKIYNENLSLLRDVDKIVVPYLTRGGKSGRLGKVAHRRLSLDDVRSLS